MNGRPKKELIQSSGLASSVPLINSDGVAFSFLVAMFPAECTQNIMFLMGLTLCSQIVRVADVFQEIAQVPPGYEQSCCPT